MFAIFLVVSMFSQGLTIVSYGNSFITAFPENLGYYYTHTSRSLRVTALLDGTSVDIFYNGGSTPTKTISNMQKGQTALLVFPKSAEVYQLDYATQSIRISSTKNIVVHSGSNTDDGVNKKSVQTNVVQPDENLDTHYLIPSLNYTDLLATFGISPPDIASKRYGSFRLIIINAEDTENNITIVKNISGSIQLESFMIPSYQLIQLHFNASLMMVNSSSKIAVLLTHPCLEKPGCTCSILVHQILPVRFQGQNFVVPSFPGITQRWLLDTSNDKTNSLPQNNTNLRPNLSGLWSISDPDKYVTASSNMSLRLISPGLFIELIPENMFAACYLLHFYTNNKQAIVIAKTDSKDQVHVGTDTLQSPGWTAIPDTEYSSATIPLNDESSVIWHPSSKIAVYILEDTLQTIYGGPAIPINEKPDKSGCVVIPGVFNVGHEPLKWAESLDSCAHDQKEFACPTDEGLQMDLVSGVGTTDVEGWIGLRRSLMTTEWYWKNQTSPSSPSPPVTYVNWGDGEPQDTLKGFCASLSLDGTDDFKWKSAKCCEEKFPICYKPPTTIVPVPWPYQTENIP